MDRVYLIADTHFNHKNIIRYCSRPFSDVDDMNRQLVRNWNAVVSKNDIVYFLGDWGLNYGKKDLSYWVSRLNGKILNIKGSHDYYSTAPDRQMLIYHGIRFMLIHNPKRICNYDFDWLIHGHLHNNDIACYPFVNREYHTVNVSVELIDYRPISMEEILCQLN